MTKNPNIIRTNDTSKENHISIFDCVNFAKIKTLAINTIVTIINITPNKLYFGLQENKLKDKVNIKAR